MTIAPFRPFRAAVAAVEDLTPHLRRIRFGGPDLEHFGDPGWDQRIKLIVPRAPDAGSTVPAGDLADDLGPDWYAGWLALADEVRPPMRTYTTRRVVTTDLGRAVDVDIVIHEESGPAGDWARRARPGDELVLVGPDARFGDEAGGRAFVAPPGVEHIVLAGDETALPAIARILEDLAGLGDVAVEEGEAFRRPQVSAFIEVPQADDILDLRVGFDATVTWLPRGEAATGALLAPAVREWARARAVAVGAPGAAAKPGALGALGAPAEESPDEPVWDVPAESDETPEPDEHDEHGATRIGPGGVLGDVYLWIAAESSVVKGIRRHLVAEVGVARDRVAFMGYWKLGTSL